jgi:2-polyprenyl-3-methyl-5-hydroxy-6-metoxy-1,4-benzoquinol methylase
MNNSNNYKDINKALWNKRTPVHIASDFYNDAAFRQGASILNEPELELLGDIAGKELLHLQCHFGQDTLAMARMGATVSGLDISDAAIDYARQLAADTGIPASFYCADVYEPPVALHDRHDVVFTSYGTIVWLPDLNKWAHTIAACLKPGGRFVFADTHPVALMFDDNFQRITYPYFNMGAIEEIEKATYADQNAEIGLPSVTWNHSVAEIVQALLNAGLQLHTIREYDYIPCNCFGNMTEVAPGRFQVTGSEGLFPMVLGLVAVKL